MHGWVVCFGVMLSRAAAPALRRLLARTSAPPLCLAPFTPSLLLPTHLSLARLPLPAVPALQSQRSPVTEYFFWPRKDAWEELKAALDSRGWIGEREKVLLLNQCTEVRRRAGRAEERAAGVVPGASQAASQPVPADCRMLLLVAHRAPSLAAALCTAALTEAIRPLPSPLSLPACLLPPSAAAGDQLLAGREQALPGRGPQQVPQLQVPGLLSSSSSSSSSRPCSSGAFMQQQLGPLRSIRAA